jgi:hypothetical protein
MFEIIKIMKKMKVVVLMQSVLFSFISFTGFSQSIAGLSQSVTVNLANIYGCKGDTVTVPLTVKGFSNICAVGIRVNYDTTALKYVKCVNINGDIHSADFAEVHSFVTLGWFSSNEKIIANIKDDDKLFAIKFICLKNTATDLNFVKPACIAADCNLKQVQMTLNVIASKGKKKCH